MKRLFISIISLAAAAAMTGCSHNPMMMAFGKVAKIGNIEYGEISYINGVYILDVSRENSSWELEVNDETGIQVDAEAGAIKGIKKIKRTIGKQISGNLVDLAKVDTEAAESWVGNGEDAMKAKGQKLDNLNPTGQENKDGSK